MEIGQPLRVVTVEPVVDPIPREPAKEPVRPAEPRKPARAK